MENDATSENVVETLIEVEAKEGILHTSRLRTGRKPGRPLARGLRMFGPQPF